MGCLNFGWIVQCCSYTPLWGADEVSELSWWLISAIHDEGLTLCEQLKKSWMLQWGQWNEQQGSGMQVGRGLSKDAKALKLGLQHWLEAVSVCDLQSLPFKLFCHPPFYFLLTIFLAWAFELGIADWSKAPVWTQFVLLFWSMAKKSHTWALLLLVCHFWFVAYPEEKVLRSHIFCHTVHALVSPLYQVRLHTVHSISNWSIGLSPGCMECMSVCLAVMSLSLTWFCFGWYRLDIGEGKDVELESCSRSKLEKGLVTYLDLVFN